MIFPELLNPIQILYTKVLRVYFIDKLCSSELSCIECFQTVDGLFRRLSKMTLKINENE